MFILSFKVPVLDALQLSYGRDISKAINDPLFSQRSLYKKKKKKKKVGINKKQQEKVEEKKK